MKYTVNFSALSNTFPVPAVVADKYLKLASESQLKVLLFVMRNLSDTVDNEKIASALGISVSDTVDALEFWAQAGIMTGEKETKKPREVVIKKELPSPDDVLRRGLEDEKLKFLLREAQLKFGRNLNRNESALLVSLYDDDGMDVPVILMLLQYCQSQNKCNYSNIRRVALSWLKADVTNVADAEEIIAKTAKADLAWSIVLKAFGLERRRPSEKEKATADMWINEWGVSEELLKAAYDAGVDSKSKFDFSYTAAIIKKWHEKGVKSVDDIEKKAPKKQKGKKNDYGTFDIELFEKMLDED